MKLTDYFLKQDMTVTEFSKSIEYSKQYVSAIMKGKIKPGAKFIRDIERATKGLVKKEDLLNAGEEDCLRCFYCKQHRFPDEAA